MLVWLQDVVYHSAFDNLYSSLDNFPDTPSLPSHEHPPAMLLEQNEEISNESALELSKENKDRCRYESVSSEGMGSDDGNMAITVEDLEIPTMTPTDIKQSGVPPLKHFYFYQGMDSCSCFSTHSIYSEVHILLCNRLFSTWSSLGKLPVIQPINYLPVQYHVHISSPLLNIQRKRI
jgi:hypothetical protein